MSTGAIRVLLLATALFLAMGPSALAFDGSAGKFATVLKSNLCSGGGYKMWGCYAYMHYRVDYAKNKSDAKGTCNWACNNVKNDRPHGFLDQCLAGCDMAYSQDTQ